MSKMKPDQSNRPDSHYFISDKLFNIFYIMFRDKLYRERKII